MVNTLEYFKAFLQDTSLSPTLTDGDSDSLSNDILLSDATNYLVLEVTDLQYSMLLSACLNGVKTTYPDDYIAVLYPLIKAGKLSFCDQIISCIEDENSGVASAIQSIVNNSVTTYDYSQTQNMSDLSGGLNPTCDEDMWYGACLELVQYMNRVNEDALEVFEASTNVVELAGELFGNIGGRNATIISSILDVVAWLQDDIVENYLANYDVDLEKDIACGLWCIAVENCALTPTDVFNYFRDKLVESFNIDSLFNVCVDFLITGSYTGDQLVYAMMLAQMVARAGIGIFLGNVAYEDLETATQYGNDVPNSDWDECTCGWEYTFDFEVSDGSWEAVDFGYGDIGVYSTGIGWIFTDTHFTGTDYRRACWITREFTSTNVTYLSFKYDLVKGSVDSAPLTGSNPVVTYGGSNVYDNPLTYAELVTGDNQTLIATGDDTSDGVRIYLSSSQDNDDPNYSGSLVVKSCTVKGTGVNPFS